ncbi:MAG: DNA repair protein RadA [Candidatus Dasytiphilus stammeri]
MKVKDLFICNKCKTTYPRWKGQCNCCKQWNTILEIPLTTKWHHNINKSSAYDSNQIQLLSLITVEQFPRFSTGFKEFDRVLGGGIVSGTTILIGGNPGTGKSTLLLQTLCNLSKKMKAIYVTGEESLNQVALRAHRLNLSKFNVYMLATTSIEQICLVAEQEQPSIIVIDSIQVMHMANVRSSPGSVAQVREIAAYLTQFAKKNLLTIIIIGHVTKDGILAGPKVLEHCIDCSLFLDATAESNFRILRSHKNRFGAINELGIFSMTEYGLSEVNNPSAIFINRRDKITTGSAIMAIWEGTRTLLVEIQVLVNHTMIIGHPKRVVVGLEHNRLTILLAVLHRHGGVEISDLDIFVNVVGGVKVTETSVDLALLLALVSSLRNIPIPIDIVIFGEVGLSGEIRPVPSSHARIVEAAKHGFRRAIIPIANFSKDLIDNITVFGVKSILDALVLLAKFWGISNSDS